MRAAERVTSAGGFIERRNYCVINGHPVVVSDVYDVKAGWEHVYHEVRRIYADEPVTVEQFRTWVEEGAV